MSDTKALTGVEIKDAEKGLVEAVFATLDVVDHDGDVTVKGAFSDGEQVRISAYGHKTWEGALPVGRGVIRSGEKEVVLEGRFFMGSGGDRGVGRDTFEVVKEMAELQEWSYGFDVLESTDEQIEEKAVRVLRRLKVHEVSPVMLGAGVGTRTLVVKQQAESFSDQAERVLGDAIAVVNRAKAFGSMSAEQDQKEGSALSAANRGRLSSLRVAWGDLGIKLDEFLAATDPNKHRDVLIRELMRAEHLRHNSQREIGR